MAFRDIFRRKTHKEKYEEAEKVVKETKKVAEAAHQEYKIRKEKGKIFFRLPNEPIGLISDGLHRPYEEARAYATQEWYDSAKRRLEKLYAQGHKEALTLNKKYDALVAEREKIRDKYHGGRRPSLLKKLKNAHENVYNFEKKELGMHGENERYLNKRKKDLSTITGIISIGALILASVIATNITGNIIGNNGGVNVGGAIFLLVGLVFGVVWLFLRKQ